jgi:hypothetical protein
MLEKELRTEDLAKLALDKGQISQDTYNRMVPPINPEAPVLEATNLLPSVDGVAGLADKVYPGVGTLATKAADAIGGIIPAGGENMPGLDNAMAEVPIRNPAFDQEPEIDTTPPGYLQQNAPQSGQASGANPMAGLEGAFNKQKNAIMGAAKIGAEAAAAEAGYQQKMFDESEKMRAQQMEIDAQRATKLKSYEDQLNMKMDEYAKRPANVAQVFANAGTGQKLLMGVAMFLGAAPNSTGQNKAISAMQTAIESDLAKAKSEVGDRKNAYQEMKATFQDERQADAAARLAYLNNAQLKLNQIASQYKGPQILKNAELLTSKIEEEREKAKMSFMAASEANIISGKTPEQLGQQLDKILTPADKALTDTISRSNAAKETIANQIDSALKNWDNLTEGGQLQQGRQLLKILNSTEGKDAIGVEEAERLGSKLQYAYGNFSNDNPTQFGRDLKGFKEDAENTLSSIRGGIKKNAQLIDRVYGKYGIKSNSAPDVKEKQGYVNYVEKKK